MVLFEFNNSVVSEVERNAFQKLVRSAFAQRRKVLRTSLVKQGLLSSEEAEKIWTALQLSSTARAEELSVEQFVRLLQTLN